MSLMKQELRKLIRERKALYTIEERKRLSEEICAKVKAHPLWEEASTVLLYHALPDEVNTELLLGCKDKTLLLPVVVGDDLELRYYTGATSEGAYHIQEPVGEIFTDYDTIDLAIIPGMAFDAEGHRLGRGKGYYDRLLPRIAHAYRMGICFPFQLLEEVPCEHHDMIMDEIIHGGIASSILDKGQKKV